MMDALTSSYSQKIIANGSSSCCCSTRSRARLLSLREIRFVQSLPKLDCGVFASPRSLFFQTKLIGSFASQSASLDVQQEADAETVEETQGQLSGQSETVHVKFKLQRECKFGEHFFLIGDDPFFGLWNPEDALLLDWSEGHIWTTELDIPVGKTIQFKFILKGISGEIVWQPGPDRSFETWGSKNTIVISDDWENALLQEITEEPVGNLIEESVSDSRKELVFGLTVESMISLAEEPDLSGQVVGSSDGLAPVDNVININNNEITDGNEIPETNEIPVIKEVQVSYGPPVLVPGLSPSTDSELSTEDTVREEVTNATIDTSIADEANNYDLPKISEKQEHDSSNQNLHNESTLMNCNTVLEETFSDSILEQTASEDETEVTGSGDELRETLHSSEEPNIESATMGEFKNDIHWAGKTLQKLIYNLGFLKSQQLN